MGNAQGRFAKLASVLSIALLLCAAPGISRGASVEAELWNRIKDGSDVLLFETYLAAFPNGEHAAAARARLEALQAKQEATDGAGHVAVKKAYLPGEPGWIGATISTVEAIGLDAYSIGTRIDSTIKGGPADKAGFRSGDIIVAIEGKGAGRHTELAEVIQTMLPGTTVNVNVVRKAVKREIDLTIGGRVTDVRELAEAGDAAAQMVLALGYSNGSGVAKDAGQAFAWAKRAADQGRADAQNFVGYCYDRGEGVTADAYAAVAWFRRAAVQNDAASVNYLGTYYELGRGGLPKSLEEATIRYRRAAVLGNDFAIRNLERLDQELFDLAGIQSGLAALGHDPGPIDGKMGSRTKEAIKAFQSEALVPIDGQPSLELARLLDRALVRMRASGQNPGDADSPAQGDDRESTPKVASGSSDFSDLDALE